MTPPSRPARALVRAYPPRFRARYGEELTALVAEAGGGWRQHADLARGALRAWADPCFAGDRAEQRRARLQTTTTTVLVAWCASLLAAAGFSKAVDDPRLPGLHGAAWAAYGTGTVAVEALAGVVLVAGFVCWLAVVVPAARRRRRDVLVPAVAPAAIVLGWFGVTGLVALFAHHVIRRGSVALTWPHGALVLAVLVAWLVVTVVCAFGCAAAAALALRRAGLSDDGLARTTVVAAVAGAGVAVQGVAATVCLVLLLGTGGGLAARDIVFSAASAAVLLVATTTAAVSGARGLAALRTVPT
jgi:hypothetical protein